MCGIVGYIGHQRAEPILIKGLKRLEYRGYDSAGIALVDSNGIAVHKKRGKVQELQNHLKTSVQSMRQKTGIAHTRWATHGEPNDVNAHPHASENNDFVVVHNGIVENYQHLRKELESKGHIFASQTDTEVLVHLIEECYSQDASEVLEGAVRCALRKVVGTYGLVVVSKYEPDTLITARKGSPVVIGVGSGEYFVASDAVPLVDYTKSVIYLNDGDMAVIKADQLTLKTVHNELRNAEVHKIEYEADELEKSGYKHFMQKEIHEQPLALTENTRGRVRVETHEIKLGGLIDIEEQLKTVKRIVILACGTSWHASLIGKYLIESLVNIPVEADYASEYRYRNPIINEGDVVFAVSQSGETADTLEAIRLAKSKGALVLGICNVVGSSIARETVAGVYTHAGAEIGVASTKAFTTQISTLAMIALRLGKLHASVTDEQFTRLLTEISRIPELVETIVKLDAAIYEIAAKYKDATSYLFMGRGYNFPVALEGALKLKEISYIHAEGYPSGEMKHGPIALIDETMPVVFITPQDLYYEKNMSNMQEVKARKGNIIAIATQGDEEVSSIADHVLYIPETEPLLTPLLTVVPLQILAYHTAVLRGCNVDQPRNLAKSVTVE